MKNALSLILCCAALSALSDKTWTGATSTSWSDPSNWSEGAIPSNGESVTLTAGTPFAPTNLDIPDLHLNAIVFDAAQTEGFTLSGEKVWLKKLQASGAVSTVVTNTILNDVVIDQSNLDLGLQNNNLVVHLAGTVSDDGRGYGIYSGSYGTVVLSGENTYGGRTDFNLGVLRFFDDANLGSVPAEPRSMSLACRFSDVILDYPDDRPLSLVRLASTRTIFKQLKIMRGVELFYDGGLEEMLDRNSGFAFLGSETGSRPMPIVHYGGSSDPAAWVNQFYVGGNGQPLLLILESAPTYLGSQIYAHMGTVDFNGHDSATPLGVYNGGPSSHSVFINSDRDHESVLSGDVIPHYEFNCRLFGGPGDIRLTGATSQVTTDGVQGNRPLWKNDSGTLTLATTACGYLAETIAGAGTMVLDHTSDNSAKINQNSWLGLGNAKLVVLGSDTAPTVESVTALDVARGDRGLGSGLRTVEVVAGDADCTFSFGNFLNNNNASSWPADKPVDFRVRSTGSGTASIVTTGFANKASFGGFGPAYIWNGGVSWAAADENGVVGPISESLFTADGAGDTLCDATSATLSFGNANVLGIRFRNPAGTTVTIADSRKLRLPNINNQCAILMTPDSGDVTITGGSMDHRGYHYPILFEQFNPNATLHVQSKIIKSVNLSVMAVGPGTVSLENDENTFDGYVGASGGATLVVSSISPVGTVSACGDGSSNNGILLGDDATFRYAGTAKEGHTTDRSVVLSGEATIEAAGEGPVSFTREGDFLTTAWVGSFRLTLSGAGEGSIAGNLKPGFYGSLRKTGTGIWTLQGQESLFYYPTEVEEGTLRLSGNLPSDTHVATGATLEALPGAVVQRSLSLDGTLRYVAGDREPFSVWGRASLGGALDIKGRLDGPTVILTAANGVEGTFDVVPPNVILNYTKTSVIAKSAESTIILIL